MSRAFLNGYIIIEVYVEQPPDFKSDNHVVELNKASIEWKAT